MQQQFKVTRKKDNKVYTVYSVQMMIGQSAIGQPAPVVLFLIYNEEKDRWELIEASEFVPESVKKAEEKKPVMGSDSILLK